MFKSVFAEEKEAIISLCTFPHADGGMVLFGVADAHKESGVSLDKNRIENFSNKL